MAANNTFNFTDDRVLSGVQHPLLEHFFASASSSDVICNKFIDVLDAPEPHRGKIITEHNWQKVRNKKGKAWTELIKGRVCYPQGHTLKEKVTELSSFQIEVDPNLPKGTQWKDYSEEDQLKKLEIHF